MLFKTSRQFHAVFGGEERFDRERTEFFKGRILYLENQFSSSTSLP